jgi:hypothetical protein
MEKRYQVFVSSTFLDLQEERRQVIQALLELDCIPAGMELFPAADDTQRALIQRVIDDCDYYVVLIGGRYGSTDNEGVSFTEREYDYAVSRGLPVLGFVHGAPETIPVGKSDTETAARQRLTAFREKVQKRMCKLWRTPEELGGIVSRSLILTIKTRPAEGWVRARHAASPEQLNALRERIDELTKELDHARIAPPAEAEGLAKGAERFTLRYTWGLLPDVYKSVNLGWDELIAAVGPAMFGEASERQLREQIEKKIIGDESLDARFDVTVVEEDFQTIKVQLFALGLTQRSTKKRSASDTQTYWSLTPYGERYVTALKAVKTTDDSEVSAAPPAKTRRPTSR